MKTLKEQRPAGSSRTTCSAWVVRQATQVGVGLDPYLDLRGKNPRKKQVAYLKGHYWQGGPKTANTYETKKEAESASRKYGAATASGSACYGHVWPSEVVTLDQALEEESQPNAK